MQDHFNDLTPAEAERLAMLAEEAAEVIQVVDKILRHGYSRCHPDRLHVSNRELLNNELADFRAVQLLMEANKDVFRTGNEIKRAMFARLNFLLAYKGAFFYNKDVGGGMAVESYNPFTDLVKIRHSLRGYVTCFSQKKRLDFLRQVNNPLWEHQS